MSAGTQLTIISVVKNGADHFEETILSVIAQRKTFAEIDLIVVDGGSSDGTIDILKKYSDHITYWTSGPDNGIYDAMNKGWAAAADNSFILFLGAGDRIISLPTDLKSHGQNEVIYGSVCMGDKAVFKSRADFHLNLYNSLHHQALLVNKGLHPAPPFNCRYRIYADFDFNQRLKKQVANFVFSPDFIGYACPGGVSDRHCFTESLRIIFANYGYLWVFLAFLSYCAMKIVPFLKRLRPFREIERNNDQE
jgi:glycosyltransferase involved in cell wall biosynthesis